MRKRVLALIAAAALGTAASANATPARVGGYDFDDDDAPSTVVTRRVVREEVVERPVVYRPRRIVREVVVERPPVYRPRPAFREVVVERRSVYGPRPVGFAPPPFDPYD